MKTKILPFIICAVFTGLTVSGNAQANQSLSNLTSPTAINQSLLPGTAHSKNLGSSSNQWQYLYLYGRIYINGVLTMHAHGTQNFFAGPYAGNTSVTGTNNTGTGEFALTKITLGSDNTANGLNALYFNTTGDYNSATGSYALYSSTVGASNTANGANSLLNNTTGNYNTAVGASALTYAKSGNYNTAVGFAAFPTTNSYQNSTALGYEAIISASNQVRIGNSSITSIGGYTNWSNVSDGRVKKNIKGNVPGLAFINQLNPVTYNLDLDAADKILQPPALKDKDGKVLQPSQQEITARKEKEQIIYSGFIAQDVEAAAKKISYDFSGVDAPTNNKGIYGLRYSEFVVPLVKAVQELSAENDSLHNQNLIQQKINADLEQRLAKLETMMNAQSASTFNQQQTSTTAVANLSQNSPNPFSNSTTISYSIAQKFSSAKIIITNKNGNTLKQINLSNSSPAGGSWKGAVIIDASTLPSGAYQYSLYVDGKLMETKQMEHLK